MASFSRIGRPAVTHRRSGRGPGRYRSQPHPQRTPRKNPPLATTPSPRLSNSPSERAGKAAKLSTTSTFNPVGISLPDLRPATGRGDGDWRGGCGCPRTGRGGGAVDRGGALCGAGRARVPGMELYLLASGIDMTGASAIA